MNSLILHREQKNYDVMCSVIQNLQHISLLLNWYGILHDFQDFVCTFQTSPMGGEGDTYAQWCHHDQELCVEGSGMSHGLVEGTGARWVFMLLKMKGRYRLIGSKMMI